MTEEMRIWIDRIEYFVSKIKSLEEKNARLKFQLLKLNQNAENERVSKSTEDHHRKKLRRVVSEPDLRRNPQIPVTIIIHPLQIEKTCENNEKNSSELSVSSESVDFRLDKIHVEEEPVDEIIPDDLQTESQSMEEDIDIDIRTESLSFEHSMSKSDGGNSIHDPTTSTSSTPAGTVSSGQNETHELAYINKTHVGITNFLQVSTQEIPSLLKQNTMSGIKNMKSPIAAPRIANFLPFSTRKPLILQKKKSMKETRNMQSPISLTISSNNYSKVLESSTRRNFGAIFRDFSPTQSTSDVSTYTQFQSSNMIRLMLAAHTTNPTNCEESNMKKPGSTGALQDRVTTHTGLTIKSSGENMGLSENENNKKLSTQCPECLRIFTSNKGLQTHMNIHKRPTFTTPRMINVPTVMTETGQLFYISSARKNSMEVSTESTSSLFLQRNISFQHAHARRHRMVLPKLVSVSLPFRNSGPTDTANVTLPNSSAQDKTSTSITATKKTPNIESTRDCQIILHKLESQTSLFSPRIQEQLKNLTHNAKDPVSVLTTETEAKFIAYPNTSISTPPESLPLPLPKKIQKQGNTNKSCENNGKNSSELSVSSESVDFRLDKIHVEEEPVDEIIPDDLQTESQSMEEDIDIDIRGESLSFEHSKSKSDGDNSMHDHTSTSSTRTGSVSSGQSERHHVLSYNKTHPGITNFLQVSTQEIPSLPLKQNTMAGIKNIKSPIALPRITRTLLFPRRKPSILQKKKSVKDTRNMQSPISLTISSNNYSKVLESSTRRDFGTISTQFSPTQSTIENSTLTHLTNEGSGLNVGPSKNGNNNELSTHHCLECVRSFISNKALQAHMRIHTKLKLYETMRKLREKSSEDLDSSNRHAITTHVVAKVYSKN